MLSNGHGFGSIRTEPLRHGLTVYWFQKNLMFWFGFSINGLVSVLKLGFVGLVQRFIGFWLTVFFTLIVY